MDRKSWEEESRANRREWYANSPMDARYSVPGQAPPPRPQSDFGEAYFNQQHQNQQMVPPDQQAYPPEQQPPAPPKNKSANKRAWTVTGVAMVSLIAVGAGITSVVESFSFDHQVEELGLVGMTEQEAMEALEGEDTDNVETVFSAETEAEDYDPELDYVVSAYDVNGNDVEIELSYHVADEIINRSDWLGTSLPELQRELSAYEQGADYSIYTDTNGAVYVESNWSVADVGLDDDDRVVFVLTNHFFGEAEEAADDIVDDISEEWNEVGGDTESE